MSLRINTDSVVSVLLIDGWHDVYNSSFDLDAYEFGIGGRDWDLLHGGGDSNVCATGFSFLTDVRSRMSGPLTAVLAVRTKS